jgi:predicted NBD/HSP70 family sugar kinase
VVARWFDLLATGVANLLYAFDPERVVIGGGITARGDVFLDELSDALRPRLGPDFHGQADLALAAAGNDAGLIGAARLWFERHAPTLVDTRAAAASPTVA